MIMIRIIIIIVVVIVVSIVVVIIGIIIIIIVVVVVIVHELLPLLWNDRFGRVQMSMADRVQYGTDAARMRHGPNHHSMRWRH